MYFVYQNLFYGTLICPLSFWQLGLKLECICWTGKSVTKVFRDQQIHVLNELPTNKDILRYHKIMLCYAIHTTTRKKQVFWKKIFLSVLHDQTSVESISTDKASLHGDCSMIEQMLPSFLPLCLHNVTMFAWTHLETTFLLHQIYIM